VGLIEDADGGDLDQRVDTVGARSIPNCMSVEQRPGSQIENALAARIEAGARRSRERIELLRRRRKQMSRDALLAEAAVIRSELERLHTVAALALVLDDLPRLRDAAYAVGPDDLATSRPARRLRGAPQPRESLAGVRTIY
jgi:hypothetical protein